MVEVVVCMCGDYRLHAVLISNLSSPYLVT